ncbi:MAG: sugar ABC transporter substrate-binding protein [bacterium]
MSSVCCNEITLAPTSRVDRRFFLGLRIGTFLFLGIVYLGGCSSRHEEGPVSISVWEFGGVPARRAWARQAVDNFNASHKSIQIELELRDWDTQRESLVSAVIVGDGPDIISVHHKYAVEFGELGGLLPLEQFEDLPEIASRLFPSALQQVQFEGKHYGIPVTMLPFVLAVNKKILKDNNLDIPTTWEDLLEMGPVLKAQGVFVLTMPGGANLDTAYRFLSLLYKAGGRVFDENWSRAAFDGPAGIAALSLLARLRDAGYFPPASAAYKFDENAALWSSGKAAMSIEGPWWQGIVSDNFEFDISKLALAPVPGPRTPIENNNPGTLLDVVMSAIPSYTKDPEATWGVLKALYIDDPVWLTADPAMGGLPTQKAVYETKGNSGYIDLELMAAEAQVGIGWPGHPAITEVQRHIADAVNSVLAGRQAPQEALSAAADEVNELLDEY